MIHSKILIERTAEFITANPWKIIFVMIGLVAACASGIIKLDFKSDYRVFFSDDNPQLQAFNSIQDTYNKSDNVLFVIESADGEIFSKSTLQAIIELTDLAWQIPYASRVDSITNFQHAVSDGDDLIVADLVSDTRSLSDTALKSIKHTAVNEPLLVDRLISKNGHVSGVNVTVQLPQESALEAIEVTQAARDIVKKIDSQYPHLSLHLTGIVMMNNAFIESALNDNATLAPLMLLIVIIALVLCVKSFSATFSVIFLIFCSIAAALGLFGWQGHYLTLASAPAPIIIMTMAVADCVHFLVAMLHDLSKGLDKKSAIKNSFIVNFQPIVLTSLTTAIGFLSLNFSDAPPYRDLGNVVAIGVIAALLLSLTFLPALMTLLPVKIKLTDGNGSSIMKFLAHFVIRYRTALLWINASLAIILSSFSYFNELNDELLKYFDESIEFRQATNFLNENMGGIYTIEFVLDAQSEGGINEPDFLADADRFVAWLKTQPETIHVNTITDTFKRLNRSMHQDDPAFYRLPEERNLAAQYLLMYEMSLPYGLDLNDQVDIAKSATRIIATTENLSSSQMLDFEHRAKYWLDKNLTSLKYEIASPGLMFSHIGKRNIASMVIGTLLALSFISVILIVAFRSLRLGLLSLAPNLMPAGIAFGLWGLIDGQINLGLSIVVGMTLGIVVDDTVHFISKYQRARLEKNLDREDAVEYAFSTVGNAMWITTAVLVSGFIVLSFSDFTMNANMGLLTAITITTALWIDLLFLPPLLLLCDKK
ncbi:MAG: RND transporter [Gammaproteobacteria bacterium HGW-Gammaproteobacteria-10]|nr:MAG: RND transporter [Gammaproteobacteria bacterium HGW-Gammaproteobacteria-10]